MTVREQWEHHSHQDAYNAVPHGDSETIDLRRVARIVRRRRWTILLPALILGLLSSFHAATKPKTFNASSTLLLDANLSSAVESLGGLSRMLPDDTVEDARVILSSDKLAGDVLDQLGLMDDRAFMNPPSSVLRRTINTAKAPVDRLRDRVVAMLSSSSDDPEAGGLEAEEPLLEDAASVGNPARQGAIARLQHSLNVSRVGRSTAIAATYSSTNPVLSAKVANAYADAYLQDLVRASAEASGRTTSWMRGRLAELHAQAEAAAEEAERFRAEHDLTESVRGGLLTLDAVAELNASLSAAKSEAANARAILQSYDSAVELGVEGLQEGQALAISGTLSETLATRIDTYNTTRARLDRLIRDSGPNHARVPGLRQTLAAAADRLFYELTAQRELARSAAEVAQARVDALQESLDGAVSSNTEKSAEHVRLQALERQAQTLAGVYQQTLSRLQEVEQQQSFPVSNARVLSYASVPRAASGPSLKRGAATGFLLGLFFGLLWAALKESRQHVLRTGSDVVGHSRLRFLGYLPELPKTHTRLLPRPVTPSGPPVAVASAIGHREGGEAAAGAGQGTNLPAVTTRPGEVINSPIPVLYHPNSTYAETLRNVRLTIEGGEDRPGVVAVTSLHPYEGRPGVALNLAGILGVRRSGSVLIVDADPRLSGLSRALGLQRHSGLADALEGRANWADDLVTIGGTNVQVLPAGVASSGLGVELMDGPALRQLLGEMRQRFDRIVLDVAGLFPVVEGRAVLRLVDDFLIVGEWGKTPSDMIETILADDPGLQERCLGMVLDGVDLRRLRDYTDRSAEERYLSSFSRGTLSAGR